MYICNAIITHTHSAFSLFIFEYINIENLSKEDVRKLILSRKQYYLDTLEPFPPARPALFYTSLRHACVSNEPKAVLINK
jgi:hypothetical protein